MSNLAEICGWQKLGEVFCTIGKTTFGPYFYGDLGPVGYFRSCLKSWGTPTWLCEEEKTKHFFGKGFILVFADPVQFRDSINLNQPAAKKGFKNTMAKVDRQDGAVLNSKLILPRFAPAALSLEGTWSQSCKKRINEHKPIFRPKEFAQIIRSWSNFKFATK